MNIKSVCSKARTHLSSAAWPEIVAAADSYLRRIPSALLHGCCTRAPLAVGALHSSPGFSCK